MLNAASMRCKTERQFTAIRVATAQGKPGIWKSIFLDRENTGNLLKNIKKYVFTQGIYHQHRENFELKENNELVI